MCADAYYRQVLQVHPASIQVLDHCYPAASTVSEASTTPQKVEILILLRFKLSRRSSYLLCRCYRPKLAYTQTLTISRSSDTLNHLMSMVFRKSLICSHVIHKKSQRKKVTILKRYYQVEEAFYSKNYIYNVGTICAAVPSQLSCRATH